MTCQQTRRLLALSLGAAGVSACATTATPPPLTPPLPRPGAKLVLAPVHVAEDRVIRVVTGLRPYRASGFSVRAEKLGDKLLVHDYGHGGGGVTLSWGTAELAVDVGFGDPGDYAVIGCGAVGLATARLLQRRGGRVTIYAKALPPDTTSNIAGAQWWPASVFSPGRLADPERFKLAARLAYRHFQGLVGPHYGVRWTRNYVVSERPGGHVPLMGLSELIGDLAPETRDVPAAEHPFKGRFVQQFDSMMVEPPVYLQAMLEDVLTAGGRVVVREFASPAELAALPERVVFNCTGLGSKALFGDEELEPVKGQLVFLLPQPEVTYNLLGGGGYMFPRADGVLLGGTFEHGQWNLTPDPTQTARILRQHKALFDAMT